MAPTAFPWQPGVEMAASKPLRCAEFAARGMLAVVLAALAGLEAAPGRRGSGSRQQATTCRCRTRSGGRYFLFDGSGRTCAAARRLCAALTSTEFLNALRQGIHGKIAVTYFEWAGAGDQKSSCRGASSRDRKARVRSQTRFRRRRCGARAHVDFRGAALRHVPVRQQRPTRHPPRDRCVGRRRQQ